MKLYYEDGSVTIYHADALEVLPTITGGLMQGRWTVSTWHSARSWWGVELLRRTPRAHSQARLHAGRRHLTLMRIWQG